MSAVSVDPETLEGLTEIALSIFTDCVNGGRTLQDALLAIYLSGMENAIEAQKDDTT